MARPTPAGSVNQPTLGAAINEKENIAVNGSESNIEAPRYTRPATPAGADCIA